MGVVSVGRRRVYWLFLESISVVTVDSSDVTAGPGSGREELHQMGCWGGGGQC